jgi:Zn finger protein HypA/HybF involved in hydrogenase expression
MSRIEVRMVRCRDCGEVFSVSGGFLPVECADKTCPKCGSKRTHFSTIEDIKYGIKMIKLYLKTKK